MKHTLKKVWLRIQEYRKQSVVYFLVYLGVTVLGAAILIDAPEPAGNHRSSPRHALGRDAGHGRRDWPVHRAPGPVVAGACWGDPLRFRHARLQRLHRRPPDHPVQHAPRHHQPHDAGRLLFVARLLRTRHYSYDPEK